MPSAWTVGSEKTITLTNGQRLTLQIYGINHDDLEGGGKARFTLGLRNLTSFVRQMSPGNRTTAGSFLASAMFTWLNTTWWELLPLDLREHVKLVRKRTSVGWLQTDPVAGREVIRTDAMRIFLFSQVEVTGAATHSFPGEGEQYPVFAQGLSPLIKQLNNGAAMTNLWHNRSPGNTLWGAYTNIDRYGNPGELRADTTNGGINFGICI